MEKIKILHAIGNLSMGGAEFQCLQLANNLDPERYEIGIVYLHDGPNPDAHSAVRLFKIDRGAYWNVWSIWKQIDRVIGEFNPDIVQAWLPEVISVPAAISASRRGIPVVSCHRKTLNFSGSYKMMLRDWLAAPQHFLAKKIVSNFPVMEEPAWFRSVYKRNKGCVIFNGLDLDRIKSLPPRSLEVRAEYRLIFAGRLAPQKGILTAFDALQELSRYGLDVHLTLFGEGPKEFIDYLRAYVEKLEINHLITFFGQCKDWQAFAGDVDALLCPSKGEGTSNVVLEALAAGVPVIISDIAMSRQLLTHSENALIAPSDESNVWASLCRSLLQDSELQSSLRRNGKRFSEQFNRSSMVNAYDDLYQKLLQND